MAPLPTLQTILISHLSDAAVLFTYNQPQISNAFTIQQYHDLAAALTWANCSPSIRVIVLTGKGKHYCAGKVLSPPGQGPTIEEEIEAGGVLGAVLLQFPKVLIAAVHGAAIGWGCTQLYNFDLVYASPSAVFQTPFMSLGFVPEGGSSWTFPRVMGKLHANRLLLAAEKVSAREMYVSGLVTQVLGEEGISNEDFLKLVCEKAKRIATFSGQSLQMAKANINRPVPLAEQREASIREGHDLKVRLNSEEAKAMVKAFTSKSKL